MAAVYHGRWFLAVKKLLPAEKGVGCVSGQQKQKTGDTPSKPREAELEGAELGIAHANGVANGGSSLDAQPDTDILGKDQLTVPNHYIFSRACQNVPCVLRNTWPADSKYSVLTMICTRL